MTEQVVKGTIQESHSEIRHCRERRDIFEMAQNINKDSKICEGRGKQKVKHYTLDNLEEIVPPPAAHIARKDNSNCGGAGRSALSARFSSTNSSQRRSGAWTARRRS